MTGIADDGALSKWSYSAIGCGTVVVLGYGSESRTLVSILTIRVSEM